MKHNNWWGGWIEYVPCDILFSFKDQSFNYFIKNKLKVYEDEAKKLILEIDSIDSDIQFIYSAYIKQYWELTGKSPSWLHQEEIAPKLWIHNALLIEEHIEALADDQEKQHLESLFSQRDSAVDKLLNLMTKALSDSTQAQDRLD